MEKEIQQETAKSEHVEKSTAIVQSKTYDIAALKETAEIFAKSGLFQDSREMSQCFVKIMAGREWGINPFSAMQGINVIQGKPAMSGGLIASLIKKSGKYNYKIISHTCEKAEIEFSENGNIIGTSSFTMDDASKITTKEKDNWIKLNEKFVWRSYPEAMLFNRALTKGARMYCPDVFDGAIYVPEELSNGDDPDRERYADAEIVKEKQSAPLSEGSVIDHTQKIEEAADKESLQKAWREANTAATSCNDEQAKRIFNVATNKKKKELGI